MNGWLSPKGKFYPCKINEHLDLAKKLFIGKNPELGLERQRWVKIVPHHIFIGVTNDFIDGLEDLTQEQIDFIDSIRTNFDCNNELREWANYLITGEYK